MVDPLEQAQALAGLGRLRQGQRTNELLSSIENDIQAEKNEKKNQRNLEHYIFELQKDLNRSRLLLEKKPEEGFQFLCATRNVITKNRRLLGEVHSLEYKRLFEALDFDCDNLWQWAQKHLPELFNSRIKEVEGINAEIGFLSSNKKKPGLGWSLFYLSFVAILFAIGLKSVTVLFRSTNKLGLVIYESPFSNDFNMSAAFCDCLALVAIGGLIIVLVAILLWVAGIPVSTREKKIDAKIQALTEKLSIT